LFEHWHISDFHIADAHPSEDKGFAEHLSTRGDNIAQVAQLESVVHMLGKGLIVTRRLNSRASERCQKCVRLLSECLWTLMKKPALRRVFEHP
jgi:hypothetical protein